MASWFRSWHGAPTDNKWLVIGRRANVAPGVVSAVAWALMDYASQADDRGSVNGFDVETYCAFSGFADNDVERVVSALNEKGVIVDGRLAAWDKRQPKRERDDETPDAWRERKQRQRERDKLKDANVTPCHAMSRHVTDTDTDTEQNRTEPETETEKKDVVMVADSPEVKRYRHACDLIEGNGFGMLTQLVSEQVHELVDEYPDEWIDYAFRVAVNANIRRVDYVMGVLRKLKANGTNPLTPHVNGSGTSAVSFSLSEVMGD